MYDYFVGVEDNQYIYSTFGPSAEDALKNFLSRFGYPIGGNREFFVWASERHASSAQYSIPSPTGEPAIFKVEPKLTKIK